MSGHQRQHSKLRNTRGAVMLIISDLLLHNYYSHLCQKSRTDVDCHALSSSSHAQIQHTREGTGRCVEHTSILLYTHWITAAHALFPCSLGVVLGFEIFVPETKARPRPSSDWSSRAKHTPTWVSFLFLCITVRKLRVAAKW